MMLAKVNIYYRFRSLIAIHKANYQNWSMICGGEGGGELINMGESRSENGPNSYASHFHTTRE